MYKITCKIEPNGNHILAVLSREGNSNSDLLVLEREDAEMLLESVKKTIDGENDGRSVLGGDPFAFISSGDKPVLSVRVSGNLFRGYEFSKKNLRMMIVELESVLG